MTPEERNLRVKALDLLVMAANSRDPETDIADTLRTWFREVAERDANVCRFVASEWRRYDGPALTAEGLALRERSAETADLCAERIAPWRSEQTGGEK